MIQKLKQIQIFLKEELPLLSGQSKRDNNTIISKQALSNQNKALLFELSIYQRVFEMIGVNKKSDEFLICKEKIVTERQSKNITYLQQQQKELEKQLKESKHKNQDLAKENKQLMKKVTILQKKVKQYENHGGLQKLDKLKQQIEKIKSEKQKSVMENQQLKTKTKQLTSKVSILHELNQQSQNKLADLMVATSIPPQKDNKMELMSAKEEIRRLKSKINELEQQKMNIRKHHEEKQAIYSKMIVHPH